MATKESWARFFLDGVDAGVVVSVSGREALGELFRYEVVLEAPPERAASAPIGSVATLELSSETATRVVCGVVAESSATFEGSAGTTLRVVLRPLAFRATLGRDCLAMQESTIPDVVRAVLDDVGPSRWELASSYPVFPYRAQYREDDWSYACRLLEEAGIYSWFDHDIGSMIVFSDRSSSSGSIEPSVLPYRSARGVQSNGDGVSDVGAFVATSSGRFTMRSFDPARPRLEVMASVGTGGPEIYDAPGGGPSDPAYVQRLVQLQRETAAAASAGIGGATNCVNLSPGRWFELVDHPRFDGRWFVASIDVSIPKRHEPVHVRFGAIPLTVPFRPARKTREAKQVGLQMGKVVGAAGTEVHPDPLGRVRVQLHWDRKGGWDDRAGTWMRAQQRCTPGSMLLPRVGWNVATFNEEGGVDAPALLWRIHDGDHPPEYALPANKTRVVYKTATTPGGGSFNEMYFEDRLGAEEMFINASRDMTVLVQNKKLETVDNDHTRKVGNVHDLSVVTNYTERSTMDQTRMIGANQTIEVGANRAKTVTGDDTIVIGGSRKLDVKGVYKLTVDGDRRLAVGPAMLDITLGSVRAEGKDGTMLVGGVVLKASAMGITDSGGVSVQVVGGAKIELSKRDRNLGVDKSLRELVGLKIDIETGGVYSENADKKAKWTVGGKATFKAKEVIVEAKKRIRLKCGDSILTITDSDITLEGTELKLDGAKLETKTTAIEHNP